MRMLTAVPGILIALGLIIAAPAHAATEPGRVSLRGWLGFTTVSLADINGEIRSARAEFLADTLVEEPHWDPFGGTANLGLEMEVQLTPVFSAGLGFSSQKGSLRLEALKVFSTDPATGEPAEVESFEEEPRYSSWDVVGTLGLWVPSAPGLHFGVQLGLVRGTLEMEGTHLFDTFTDLPFLEFTQGDWKGTGVVLGAFTGYEQPLSPELSLSTRMGYRYRKISTPDGILRTTRWGDQGNSREWASGPPLDSDGNPMDLDLGGFYINIGLSLGFGGGD